MQTSLTHQHILVTGGAGFIGTNLCEKFLAQDNKVRCLDNFSTGKRENIAPLLEHPNFELLEADIRDITACQKAADGIDFVFHQAALGSVPRSLKDPATTNAVNISGFLNMLIAARDAKVKRFVYAASSSTYGDHPGLPKVEERIGKPLSPYAITKYVNELYAQNFGKVYGVETIGLRYFNVFGKYQRPDGAYAAVIPKFIGLLLEGKNPEIHGDGEQSRDFTYIANVLQMNERAALCENPEAVGEVFNCAVGGRTTLNTLFEVLKELLLPYDASMEAVKPEYVAPRAGDVRHSQADIEKAARLLGYAPTHDIKQGLTEAIAWYWAQLRA